MLYDPAWHAEPYTKEHFIGWLRRQPADKTYVYGDPCNCLNAQYHREVGKSYCVPFINKEYPATHASLTTQIEWIARNCKSGPDGRTFGHALDCALSVM